MENNKNKKSVKFQGDMLNFCDFIQVFVFIRNHHLKSVNSEEHKLIRKVYDELFREIENNTRISNWVSLVKRILNHMGFAELWMQQNVGNHNIFYLFLNNV